jgi:hypothetical protein
MPRKEPTCPVCGAAFTAGEPVAWSVGRERIHESCLDLARVAAPGRAKFGPWKAPSVRVFLLRMGGRLCPSCLAMALDLSLEQAREMIHVIDGVAGLRVLPVACASCGRTTDALCVVPAPAQDRIAS